MQTEEYIVIYARVSTKGQSIERQLIKGQKLARKLGYCEDRTIEITDKGISARTTSINDREGFSQVLRMIRNKQVKVLIVSDRDRIARNMIEYLLVFEEIIKYDIKVLFSTEGVIPFTGNKGVEAELAHYAEIEGNKINNRSNDVRKYYPSMLFGYIRKGERSSTHYIQNENEIQIIKEVFNEFAFINTLSEYKVFRKEWNQKVGYKLQKVLTNTFYAGFLFNGDKIEELEHIIPIVTIEEVIGNIGKFNEWGLVDTPKDNFSERIEQMNVQVVCDYCKEPLTQRKINHTFVYYCNHKKSKENKSLSVSSKIVNQKVIEFIKSLVKNLEISKLEELSRKHLSLKKESYNKDTTEIENLKKQLSNKIISNLDNPRKLPNLLSKYEELEKELNLIKGLQDSIKAWIKDIKLLISDDFQEKIELYLQDDIVALGRMLIHSVSITNQKITVFYYLSNAIDIEGEIVINE